MMPGPEAVTATAAETTPPALSAPDLLGEPAGGPAPHTEEGRGCPMARPPDSSARAGPQGTAAAKAVANWSASAAPSFFLVSALRKWLLGWRHFR
jgi:hypothetical protein